MLRAFNRFLSGEAVVDEVYHGLALVYPKLSIDRRDVGLHGAFRDHELFRDRIDASAAHHQMDYFAFAGREAVFGFVNRGERANVIERDARRAFAEELGARVVDLSRQDHHQKYEHDRP